MSGDKDQPLTAPAIEKISELTTTALKPQAIRTDDPRVVRYVINGHLETLDNPPPPRSHQLEDLETLCAWVGHQAEDAEELAVASIWISAEADRITVLPDDADRRDLAMLAFRKSEAYLLLEGLRDPARRSAFSQRELIRFLRLGLGVDDPGLIDRFRRLTWSAESKGGSDVQHASRGLGKQIEAKVQGVDELPDEIRVEVPVVTLPELRLFRVEIRIRLEIDPENELFYLAPVPEDLEKAKAAVRDAMTQFIFEKLATEIDAGKVRVYRGAP